jgi:hypothetical protein
MRPQTRNSETAQPAEGQDAPAPCEPAGRHRAIGIAAVTAAVRYQGALQNAAPAAAVFRPQE